MTPEELLKEIEEIKSLDNPLSYCKNAEHYKNKNAIDSAYIVEQFSQYGYFAAACVKYILRRHHKGQYEQDVIKIMHTYKLARFFCSIGDVSLRSSQNHKSFQIALALIPNMIDKALISVLESALTGRDTKIIAIMNAQNEDTKKTTIDVTQANADLVFSTILKEEIKEKYGYLDLLGASETTNESFPELIVCAAIEMVADEVSETFIIPCVRHWDPISTSIADCLDIWWEEGRQGFLTNRGRFVTREEALKIAMDNNQIRRWSCGGKPSDILFSEDLY